MPSTTGAIEVDGLAKRYGPILAVDDLSLSVEAGEVFGLLGPNGAGKTTTVEVLEGYRRPDSGSVRVLGLDPIADGPALRPRIGVMLQEGGLAPGMRVHEMLSLFAAFYEDADDPARLLDVVGLVPQRDTAVRRLSGGQRQRLSLALALVGRPDCVFLDEPTAGMDPHARADTWDLVRGLRTDGVTVLLTTHAMDEAEELCDRVAIIDHGRLVACGSPSELTRSAAADETWFTTANRLSPAEIAAALGLEPSQVTEPHPREYVVGAAATPALVAELAAWLRDHDVSIGELRGGRRSLEEVFLRLTREKRS
jgi:ABC-2 type transport system ATP-binding protein